MPTSTVGVVGIDGAFVGSVVVSTALQAVLDVLPETEVVSEGQLAHTFSSVRVFDVAAGSAYFPMGHSIVPVHVLMPSPVVAPKVPAGQLLHVAFPIRENVPIGQSPEH